MVEHGRSIQDNFKGYYRKDRSSQNKYCSRLDQDGDENLDRVKSESSREIKSSIGMMHAMDAPEWLDHVKNAVLPVD